MDYIVYDALRLGAEPTGNNDTAGISITPLYVRKATGQGLTLTAVAQTAPVEPENLAGQIYPVKF